MIDTNTGGGEDMVDLVFPIRGQVIADDHAFLLARALMSILPWWEDEAEAGILPIAGLSRSDGMCYVGGRARLTIRIPRHRAVSAEVLQGTVLNIGGQIELGSGQIKRLAAALVVHSPCVDLGTADEGEFQKNCLGLLQDRGMTPELVCGRVRQFQGARGTIRGYSLMLYGLKSEQTVSLQNQGLGFNRHLGCGIFVPHKNVAAVVSE